MKIEREPLKPVFIRLFDAAPNVLLAVKADDPDFTIVAANDAYERVSGLSREQLIGKSMFEIFPDNQDNDRASGSRNLRASFQKVIEGCVPDQLPSLRYDIQTSLVQAGQFEERFWSVLNTPIVDSDGRVEYILHAVEEITDKVLAERLRPMNFENLHLNDRRFRELAQNSAFGLAVSHLNGRLLYMNPACLELLGYKEEEVTAGLVNWTQITPPEYADLDIEAARLLSNNENCPPYEKALIAKDGRRVPVSISWSRLEPVKGRVEAGAFIYDLSHHKQAERNILLARLDDAADLWIGPEKLVGFAVRLLGQHLDTDRCVYCGPPATSGDELVVVAEFTRAGVPGLSGWYALAQFGLGNMAFRHDYFPFIVDDIETDPRLAYVSGTYKTGGIRASASVALFKNGRFTGAIMVHETESSRRWLPHEVELLLAVAKRCAEAMESNALPGGWKN